MSDITQPVIFALIATCFALPMLRERIGAGTAKALAIVTMALLLPLAFLGVTIQAPIGPDATAWLFDAGKLLLLAVVIGTLVDLRRMPAA